MLMFESYINSVSKLLMALLLIWRGARRDDISSRANDDNSNIRKFAEESYKDIRIKLKEKHQVRGGWKG